MLQVPEDVLGVDLREAKVRADELLQNHKDEVEDLRRLGGGSQRDVGVGYSEIFRPQGGFE